MLQALGGEGEITAASLPKSGPSHVPVPRGEHTRCSSSDAGEKAQVIQWVHGQGLASGPNPTIVIDRTICMKG